MTTQNITSAVVNRGVAGDSAPLVPVAKGKVAPAEQPKVAVKETPTPEQLQRMLEKANKSMEKVSSNLEFSVDNSTNKTVVKVMESQSGNVIMQFPSEEMLSITRAIDMAQKGSLLKEKA